MARGHGRILSSIWEDPDFLALTQEQQRLYLFLISQPNLNHAGVLPVTLRRWARKAFGLTAADLEKHLAALHAARFIVLDDDTEELLIRSFIRNDGVWKQPKVMGSMVSSALEIESHALRRALLEETCRLCLDELSDEPTKYRGQEGPSIREQVAGHVESLRRAFGGPGPSGGGSAPPSGTPSASPSRSPSAPPNSPESGIPDVETVDRGPLISGNTKERVFPEPPAEGGTQGDTEGPYARGCGRASRALSPTPNPKEELGRAPGEQAAATDPDRPADAAKPRATTSKPSKHAAADKLAADFYETHKGATAQSFLAIRGVLRTALGNGLDRDAVAQALDKLAAEGRAISGGTLQIALQQIRQPHLRVVSGGYSGWQNPDDQDVYDERIY